MAVRFVVGMLAVLLPCVYSWCPRLRNTTGIQDVTITWTYNFTDGTCVAGVEGSSTKTTFQRGQKKSLAGLGNGCLVFVCNAGAFRLDQRTSACDYGSGCSRRKRRDRECGEPYTCLVTQYRKGQVSYSNFYRYSHSNLSVVEGYTCGYTGCGPCPRNKCFNPFAVGSSGVPPAGPLCVREGDTVVTAAYQLYLCRALVTCDSHSYLDLRLNHTGCNNNGTFVTEGTVTWSDACSQTMCQVRDGVGQLVTAFKDQEGCVYDGQCIPVGDRINTVQQHVCVTLRCDKRRVPQPSYDLEVEQQTGCHLADQCYRQNQKVATGDRCRKLQCKLKRQTGEYYWDQRYYGCYDIFTGRCTPKHKRYVVDGCIQNTCVSLDNGRWHTEYMASCVPRNRTCRVDGSRGCRHEGECFPMRSVITMDKCTQYVCSDDTPPVWKARATGCYGPTGCMRLGEQVVDPSTLHTYRCDYSLGSFGIKYADLHQACVAPNGTSVALGDSLLLGSVWYSCYREGRMVNPIDRAEVFVPDENGHTCGINPDTGHRLFKGQYYFTSVARCRRKGYFCETECQFFDQPCTKRTHLYRYLGDKFTLHGSECVCTQDYSVNNQPIPDTGSLFNTPSLCGQAGVRGAACLDEEDDSLHQWGEMWGSDGRLCTCHPLHRAPFCSCNVTRVARVLENMEV